jgi:hypothetical protein
MNKITLEEFNDMVKASYVKSRLKRELRYIPGEIANWELRDFITVTNKSGSEGVFIAVRNGRYVVLPFKLQKRAANTNGRVEAIICDICATWQRGSNSAAMTFIKERSSITFLVCRDLDCSLHARDKTPEAVLSRTQLRESIVPSEKVKRLRARLLSMINTYIS